MTASDLRPFLKTLFSPAGIAVVGASPKPGAGSNVIHNLRQLGYPGRIFPVNPGYSEVHGLECFASLAEIPTDAPLDAVAVVLGYRQVPGVLDQAGAGGVRAAWAFASGFAEAGDEGAARQAELIDLCRRRDIRFCGPNCVGFIDLHHRAGLFSAPLPPGLEPGRVGVIAQSGSVALAVVNSHRGLGLSTLVSSGNEAVLDTVDYLGHMVDDDNTGVICIFMEGLRRPDEFARLCGLAAQRRKPVIVLKVGRSEMARRTVTTHTGALAGEQAAFDAFFRRHGIIQVFDLDEMLETAELMVHCSDRLPAGNRVGAITVSGGEIGLMGDLSRDLDLAFPPLSQGAAKELGLRLPPFSPIGNPLDAWGSGDLAETYPACLEVLAAEEDIDLILVSQDSPPGMASSQVEQYTDVARAAVKTARRTDKPVIVFSHLSNGLEPGLQDILSQGGVPLLQGSRESLTAVDHLIRYARFVSRPAVRPESDPGRADRLRPLQEGASPVVGWRNSRDLLAGYGIDLCPGGLVATPDRALAMADTIGYPVALKVQSTTVLHRTEAGLVRLNLSSPDELGRAWQELERTAPGEGLEGMWLQKMAPAGAVEMLVGVNRDPVLGPMLVIGLGGVMVELVGDTALSLPPVDREQAREMIESLKGSRLLQGFRGAPRTDIDALTGLVVNLGRLAAETGDDIQSLDLNPVMVLPRGEGVWVADMVIQRRSDS